MAGILSKAKQFGELAASFLITSHYFPQTKDTLEQMAKYCSSLENEGREWEKEEEY